MNSPLVNPYVEFISLDLTHIRHSGTEVVLERVAGDASKYIDKSVVPNFGEELLLIIESVLGNDAWGTVRYLGRGQVFIWNQGLVR